MTRALVVVCFLSSIAAADTITPPAGWTADPDAAAKLDRRGAHFGGALATVKVDVYKPAARGAVLYVTRVSGAVTEHRDAAASAELAEIGAAMKRQGSGVTTDESSQRADVDKKQLEAIARWRDDAAGLATSARILIAADATTIIAVRGDCMHAGDAPKDVAAACEAALATLDPGIPADKRVALAIAEPAVAPVQPSTPDTPQQRLDDGTRTSLPPIPVQPQPQPQRETDRRPVWVGGGLVVLAIAFWWNRRRREKFEREDEEPAKRAKAKEDDDDEPGDDDDSDDLHDAARSSPARSAADDDRKDAITKESHD